MTTTTKTCRPSNMRKKAPSTSSALISQHAPPPPPSKVITDGTESDMPCPGLFGLCGGHDCWGTSGRYSMTKGGLCIRQCQTVGPIQLAPQVCFTLMRRCVRCCSDECRVVGARMVGKKNKRPSKRPTVVFKVDRGVLQSSICDKIRSSAMIGLASPSWACRCGCVYTISCY